MGGINYKPSKWGYPHYICLLCVFLLFLLFIDCFVCLLYWFLLCVYWFIVLFYCIDFYFLTTNTANIYIYIYIYYYIFVFRIILDLFVWAYWEHLQMSCEKKQLYILVYNVISGIDPMLRPSDLMVCSPPFNFRFWGACRMSFCNDGNFNAVNILKLMGILL